MSRRTDRVSSLLLTELSELVLRRVKDPRLGFVTLTHVKIAPDLRSARVYYSALGSPDKKSESQSALEHAAGFLQRQIAVSLKLRFTPKLSFHLDETLEKGIRIDQILHELENENKPERK